MQIKEQYRKIAELHKEIDSKLQDTSFEKIIQLQRWAVNSEEYQTLKAKDNQLLLFNIFCKIWIEEKQKMLDIENEKDIFWKIHNLNELQSKYYDVIYAILRIENNVPNQSIHEGIDKILKNEISGIAIGYILISESKKKKESIILMSQLLIEKNEYVRAIELLQYVQAYIPGEEDFFLQEANCWIAGEQWGQALNCLKKIPNPSGDIKELIGSIEQIEKNEKI